MPAAANDARFAQLLVRLVFGVRQAVLHRPLARRTLRALGWPALALMRKVAGRGAAPPQVPAPSPWREPVLRLPLDYAPAAPAQPPRIAVMLHAPRPEGLGEIVRELQKLPFPADVFVAADGEAAGAAAAAFADWAGGAVEIRQVRGGALAAQLALVREMEGRYDLVLLLRAGPDDPPGGRGLALDSLIGSAAQARGIIEAFAGLPSLGIVAPRTLAAWRPQIAWGASYGACRDLAARMGFALYPDSPLDVPAGGMFWARPAALRPLVDLAQGEASEAALQRLVFHACERAGLRWIHAGPDGRAEAPEAMIRVRSPAELERMVTDCGRTVLAPGRPPRPAPEPPRAQAEAKAAFRRLCAEELDAFLASEARLDFTPRGEPEVAIVLVLFNQAELTFQCLRSLGFQRERAFELIVWDNASSDRTGELLDRIDGARIVRSPENLHFLRGVNAAAEDARAPYLLLLNNDARLAPGAIAAAAARLDAEADLGAVGGKIELLDGTLQEAGSIIWRDGACLGYGRGADPWAPEFQFRRDVDYASGAFLMVRRALFERLGRFDEAFAPAYYEETDLCMRLRAAGFRVAYEPRARLQHFEFASSATPEAALALQAEHHRRFVQRHAEALAAEHLPASAGPLAGRMRGGHRGRVLIVEDRIPYPQLGTGYPRALDLLRAAHAAGWFVTFYPLVHPQADYDAAYAVIPPDVEIAAERGREGLAAFLEERAGYYDAMIVSRPHNMRAVREALARAPGFIAPERVVYDAEAIFALREQGRRRGGAEGAAVRAEVAAEMALAKGAGAVLAVNAAEAANFRAGGCAGVRVLGHALRPAPAAADFAGRRDLLFVGALDDEESPNVDSVVFLAQEVMPRLDALIGPDYVLRVAGRAGAAKVRALAGRRVQVLGRVEDLAPLYAKSRLFVAPTRFAAGMPMKVHEAAAAGLPAAVTPLLARQLGWADGEALAVGEGPDGFAQACARVYADEGLWRRLREGALARVAAECDPAAFAATVAEVLAAAGGR